MEHRNFAVNAGIAVGITLTLNEQAAQEKNHVS